MNLELKLAFLHYYIHQKVLCKSLLKINYAVDVSAKIANFIRVRALTYSVTLSIHCWQST